MRLVVTFTSVESLKAAFTNITRLALSFTSASRLNVLLVDNPDAASYSLAYSSSYQGGA